MRWSSWSNLGAAVVLIGDSYVEASLFPRAKSGDGYISVPVGTVDRPRSEAEKRQTGSIVTELENRIYFYATTSRSPIFQQAFTASQIFTLISQQSRLEHLPKR